MNKIPNRQAICETLIKHARTDPNIIVLCSDSRGSASMTPFFDRFPEQSVEVGIAEQNLVSISAGIAHCGKKVYCFSPACFLSARSYEQTKIDVAYSDTNVKLIGISGGISYGELGMSHHSLQDMAAMSAIPNMRVYLPSDRYQTSKLIEALLEDEKPAYVRVGRNPVEDIYGEDYPFKMNRATVSRFGGKAFCKVVLVVCGEMVRPAIDAAMILEREDIQTVVLDMYCVKPLDTDTLLTETANAALVVTVEEHAPFGGLGSMTVSAIAAEDPKKVIQLALPDDHVITGRSKAVFDHYGLNGDGIAGAVRRNLP